MQPINEPITLWPLDQEKPPQGAEFPWQIDSAAAMAEVLVAIIAAKQRPLTPYYWIDIPAHLLKTRCAFKHYVHHADRFETDLNRLKKLVRDFSDDPVLMLSDIGMYEMETELQRWRGVQVRQPDWRKIKLKDSNEKIYSLDEEISLPRWIKHKLDDLDKNWLQKADVVKKEYERQRKIFVDVMTRPTPVPMPQQDRDEALLLHHIARGQWGAARKMAAQYYQKVKNKSDGAEQAAALDLLGKVIAMRDAADEEDAKQMHLCIVRALADPVDAWKVFDDDDFLTPPPVVSEPKPRKPASLFQRIGHFFKPAESDDAPPASENPRPATNLCYPQMILEQVNNAINRPDAQPLPLFAASLLTQGATSDTLFERVKAHFEDWPKGEPNPADIIPDDTEGRRALKALVRELADNPKTFSDLTKERINAIATALDEEPEKNDDPADPGWEKKLLKVLAYIAGIEEHFPLPGFDSPEVRAAKQEIDAEIERLKQPGALDAAFRSLFEPETYPETKAVLELLTDSVNNSQAVTAARYKQVKTDIHNFIRYNHQASKALKAGMEYLPDIAAFMAGVLDAFPLPIPDECQAAKAEIEHEIEALKEPGALDNALKSLFEPETEGLYELLDDSVKNPIKVTPERVAEIKTQINNAIQNQANPSAFLKAQALLPDVAGYIVGIQDQFPVPLPAEIDERLAEIEKHEGASLKTANEWNGLGVQFFNEKSSIEEETACYKKALSINKKYVSAWSNLGNVNNRKNDYALAATFSLTATILDSKHGPAWHQLADQYYSLNALPSKIKTTSMVSISFDDSHFNKWNRLANVCDQKQPFHKLTCALKALSLNRKSQWALNHLAKVYRWLDTEYDRIIAFNLAALAIDSSNSFAWEFVAWIHAYRIIAFRYGKICSLASLVCNTNNHRNWSDTAYYYLQLKKHAHLMFCCQQLQTLNRHHQWSWIGIAQVYKNALNDFSSAQLCMIAALIINQLAYVHEWTWKALSSIFMREIIKDRFHKRCAYASMSFDRAKASQWTNLGNSFHKHKEYTKSEVCYKLSVYFDDCKFWSNNAQNNKHYQKRPDVALSSINMDFAKEASLSGYDGYIYRWQTISTCHYHLRNQRIAIASCMASLILDTRNSTNWGNLDFYYRHAGKVDLAFYSTREALYANPQSPRFWTNFIERLYSNNRYDEAKAAAYFRDLVWHDVMHAFFELQPLFESIHSQASMAPVEIDIESLFEKLRKDIKSTETKWPHPSDKPIAIDLYNQYRFRWLHLKLKFNPPEKTEDVEALCHEMLWCRLLGFIDSQPPQQACLDANTFIKTIQCLPPDSIANLALWWDAHEAIESGVDDKNEPFNERIIIFHETLEPDAILQPHEKQADPMVDWIYARPEKPLHDGRDESQILERRLQAMQRSRKGIGAIDTSQLLPPSQAELSRRIDDLRKAIRLNQCKKYFATEGEIELNPQAMQTQYTRAKNSGAVHKRFETAFNEELEQQLDNITHTFLKSKIYRKGMAIIRNAGDDLLIKKFQAFWDAFDRDTHDLETIKLPEFRRENQQELKEPGDEFNKDTDDFEVVNLPDSKSENRKIVIVQKQTKRKTSFDWHEWADHAPDQAFFETIIEQWMTLSNHEHGKQLCRLEDDPLWRIRDRLVRGIEKFKDELKVPGQTSKQLKEILDRGVEEVNTRIQWKTDAFKKDVPFDMAVQCCINKMEPNEKKWQIDAPESAEWLILSPAAAHKLRYILINELDNIVNYSAGEERFKLTIANNANCLDWQNRIAADAKKEKLAKRTEILQNWDYKDEKRRPEIDAKTKDGKGGTGVYRFLQFKAELEQMGYIIKMTGAVEGAYYKGCIHLEKT